MSVSSIYKIAVNHQSRLLGLNGVESTIREETYLPKANSDVVVSDGNGQFNNTDRNLFGIFLTNPYLAGGIAKISGP